MASARSSASHIDMVDLWIGFPRRAGFGGNSPGGDHHAAHLSWTRARCGAGLHRYAASEWAAASLAATGSSETASGKKSLGVTRTPIDGPTRRMRRIWEWERLLDFFRSEIVGCEMPAASASLVWFPKRRVR